MSVISTPSSEDLIWFPGLADKGSAIGGLGIAIILKDVGSAMEGGLGWGGELTLVCSVSDADTAPIPWSAWTPAAIVGTIPLTAPCTHGALYWKILVDPASGDQVTIEPVYIEGLPNSGYPPVGSH